MSRKDVNIEELFRSSLEDFEMDVNPDLWQGINSQISGANSTTLVGKSLSSKILAISGIGLSAAAIGVAATMYFSESEPKTQSSSDFENSNTITDNNIVETENAVTHVKVTKKNKVIVETVVPSPKVENNLLETQPVEKKEPKVVVLQKNKGETQSNVASKNSRGMLPPFSSSTSNQNNQETIPSSVPDLVNEEVISSDSILELVEITEETVIAVIEADILAGYAPLKVSLSQPMETGMVKWKIDGEEHEGFSTTATFTEPGIYDVVLEVADVKGNIYTDAVEIEVMEGSSINKIPNVFTPDGNGDNDVYLIQTKGMISMNMIILDQNSQMVFQTNDLEKGWDGRLLDGTQASEGSYIVQFTAEGVDGKVYKRTANLKLFR